MPQGNVNEFQVWKDQVPVVNTNTDGEFDVWKDAVPDEDRDEGQTSAQTTTRRRVVTF